MDVSVGVHYIDAVHGRHGDLRGDCQPELIIHLMIKVMDLKDCKPKVQHSEQDQVDHLLHETWLVLLPPLVDLGLFPVFEDWSKVELVVAQH